MLGIKSITCVNASCKDSGMEGFWQILTHHWSAVPAAPPAAPAPMLAIEDGSLESDPNEIHSSDSDALLHNNGTGTVAPFDPYYSVSLEELDRAESDSATEPSFSDISAEAVGQVEKASGPSESPSPDMSSPAPAVGLLKHMSTEELLEKRARLRQIWGMVGIDSDVLCQR